MLISKACAYSQGALVLEVLHGARTISERRLIVSEGRLTCCLDLALYVLLNFELKACLWPNGMKFWEPYLKWCFGSHSLPLILCLQDGARGYSNDSVGNSASLLSHIYLLARSNKQHRRVLLRALLRHFEDYEVKYRFSAVSSELCSGTLRITR